MGINPGFFEILDARLDALVDHGIAGVPVLLWAIETTEVDPGDVVMIEDSTIDPDTVPAQPVIEHNPGQFLSEDDAVVLARYLVARWHAHPVVFILNGDGDYAGEKAERWHRIGREVFGTDGNAGRPPVAVHPSGIQWVGPEFADEPWVDIIGYQSGHGGGILSWRWLQDGPLTKEAHTNSHQAIINLEACYEDHNRMYVMIGVPAGWVGRFTARDTRRALYASFWSPHRRAQRMVRMGSGHGMRVASDRRATTRPVSRSHGARLSISPVPKGFITCAPTCSRCRGGTCAPPNRWFSPSRVTTDASRVGSPRPGTFRVR